MVASLNVFAANSCFYVVAATDAAVFGASLHLCVLNMVLYAAKIFSVA